MSKLTSKFEYLPNELIYLLFDYLSCHEIINAFDKLNNRFKYLLDVYSNYHLNLVFEKIKSKLLLIHNKRLHSDRIKSLTLSGGDIFIDGANYYLSFYIIDVFYPKLESLSICNVTNPRLYSFIELLPNFKQLKRLSISNRFGLLGVLNVTTQMQDIILFRIRTLKSLVWNARQSLLYFANMIKPTEKSSIEYFQSSSARLIELIWLHTHCERLKSFQISYSNFPFHPPAAHAFPQLISLKIDHLFSMNDIRLLFKCFTELISLKHLQFQGKCELEYDMIDGNQLKDLIQKFSPQLKTFQFVFSSLTQWKYTKVQTFIQSFLTDFWLIEKKWFVTCAYQNSLDIVYIYTRPCFQHKFFFRKPWKEISTATTTTDIKVLNVREFNLSNTNTDSITSVDCLSISHSNKPDQIFVDMFYDRLDRYLSLSTVKQIEYRGQIPMSSFFPLLKRHRSHPTIKAQCDVLFELIGANVQFAEKYFRKIRSLEVQCEAKKTIERKQFESIFSAFTNVEELVVDSVVEPAELAFLLKKLEHLSFLMVKWSVVNDSKKEKIESWLSTQRKIRFKNDRLLCKCFHNNLLVLIIK